LIEQETQLHNNNSGVSLKIIVRYEVMAS